MILLIKENLSLIVGCLILIVAFYYSEKYKEETK